MTQLRSHSLLAGNIAVASRLISDTRNGIIRSDLTGHELKDLRDRLNVLTREMSMALVALESAGKKADRTKKTVASA